jgi:electron transfer flavoprotein beta subunit
LATSYILNCAVKKVDYDIVLCGRQAIDGDTAQVGPQLAEKLGIPQITYVEELTELNGKTITARRNIGAGWQQVKSKLPVLLTVTGDANEPRVAAAKKMMKYKKARTAVEVEREVRSQRTVLWTPYGEGRGQSYGLLTEKAEGRRQRIEGGEEEIKRLIEQKCSELEKKGLLIKQWDLDFLGADLRWCGRSGSPTKVHRIQSVVLAAKESKNIKPSGKGISEMIHELIEDKTIA